MAIQPFAVVYYFSLSRRIHLASKKSIPVLICMLKQCAIVQLHVYSNVYRVLWIQTNISCRLVAYGIRNFSCSWFKTRYKYALGQCWNYVKYQMFLSNCLSHIILSTSLFFFVISNIRKCFAAYKTIRNNNTLQYFYFR